MLPFSDVECKTPISSDDEQEQAPVIGQKRLNSACTATASMSLRMTLSDTLLTIKRSRSSICHSSARMLMSPAAVATSSQTAAVPRMLMSPAATSQAAVSTQLAAIVTSPTAAASTAAAAAVMPQQSITYPHTHDTTRPPHSPQQMALPLQLPTLSTPQSAFSTSHPSPPPPPLSMPDMPTHTSCLSDNRDQSDKSSSPLPLLPRISTDINDDDEDGDDHKVGLFSAAMKPVHPVHADQCTKHHHRPIHMVPNSVNSPLFSPSKPRRMLSYHDEDDDHDDGNNRDDDEIMESQAFTAATADTTATRQG